MTTIFSVITGAYEDLEVCPVMFRDEALAEQHAGQIGGQVVPFTVVDVAPAKVTVFNAIAYLRNGTPPAYRARTDEEWDYATDAGPEPKVRITGQETLTVTAYSTDPEVVEQALVEAVAAIREAAGGE